MFARLGPWCHDRRRLVLGLWVALLVVVHGIAGSLGENYRQDFSLPGQESSAGFDVLQAEFEGQGAGEVGTIVFRADQGVHDPEVRTAMEALFAHVAEHVEPWVRFASALGVSRNDLVNYAGADKTNAAVAKMMGLASASFEEAVAAMYAYEMELPKISRSKIDGLKKFYGMDSEDATKYFEIHEEADVRHAQVWREILEKIPTERQDAVFAAAVESLRAQNMLLDSAQEKYVGMNC